MIQKSQDPRRVAMITSGFLPVPDALGGAVESLDTMLLDENELHSQTHITVFSIGNDEARRRAHSYKKTSFVFFKPPAAVKVLDKLVYWVAKRAHVKKLMTFRYIIQRLWFVLRIARPLNKGNFDTVLVENHPSLLLPLKLFNNRRKYRGKVIFHPHVAVSRTYGCKRQIREAKLVCGVSSFVNATVEKAAGPLPPERFTVWRNCVDLSAFDPAALQGERHETRRSLGLSDDDLVFLFSGRLSEGKGILELLEAFSRVIETVPNAKLVLAGGYFSATDIENPLTERISTYQKQVGTHLIQTGFMPHSHMPSIYACADVSVVPSVADDAAPLSVIESMAAGLPLITTNSGGIPEYVDESCAIMLDRNHHLAQTLGNAMLALAEDPEARTSMEHAALRHASTLGKAPYYKRFLELLQAQE